jgi:hypothetical protein
VTEKTINLRVNLDESAGFHREQDATGFERSDAKSRWMT